MVFQDFLFSFVMIFLRNKRSVLSLMILLHVEHLAVLLLENLLDIVEFHLVALSHAENFLLVECLLLLGICLAP